MERQPLSDIVPPDRLPSTAAALFDAADDSPVPPGTYTCVIEHGLLGQNRNGKECYKLRFRIIDGEYAGRKLFDDLYLTEAAVRRTKQRLRPLGLKTSAQLAEQFPADRAVCSVVVTVRTADSGQQFNEVKSFTLVEMLPEQTNPFPLPEEGGGE